MKKRGKAIFAGKRGENGWGGRARARGGGERLSTSQNVKEKGRTNTGDI